MVCYATQEHSWSLPLSLILSQIPGAPTGKMALKCIEAPHLRHTQPLYIAPYIRMPMHGPPTPQPRISTRSVHTGTPSAASISGACSYTPPFASSCGQPARCESLSSTSCPPRPLQARSGCLLHNSYIRRIPRLGMLRSYLGVKEGGVGKTLIVVS